MLGVTSSSIWRHALKSEYQCCEFVTCDQPLTWAQLEAVNALSSHIDASSTHALVDYRWGTFKHDPLKVLHESFDGFLYWANWGVPELAFRIPHGILPVDLLNGYGLPASCCRRGWGRRPATSCAYSAGCHNNEKALTRASRWFGRCDERHSRPYGASVY
jgi:hypothetical protein